LVFRTLCGKQLLTTAALIGMTQGKKIAPEIQWAIVWFSWMLSIEHIAAGLDLSPRSVRRVLSYFYMHGTVAGDQEQPVVTEIQGNRRLDEDNVKAWP